ncbi:MAG: hypothetical protein FWH14_03970, partial [Oscillospiraceae bacterium]|nr:hypothetical protein [Oscillospiraceae bacterium]
CSRQAPTPLGGGVPPQRRGGLVGMTALGHPWLPQRRGGLLQGCRSGGGFSCDYRKFRGCSWLSLWERCHARA